MSLARVQLVPVHCDFASQGRTDGRGDGRGDPDDEVGHRARQSLGSPRKRGWWLPGPYDPATSPGMDCDDQDGGVYPGNGC